MSNYCKITFVDRTERLVEKKTLQFLLEVKNVKAQIFTYKYLTIKELAEELTIIAFV
jgi:hypothetical protein